MAGRKPDPNRSATDKAHADAEAQRYRSLPKTERRRIVVERDRGAQRAADARRHERDKPQRQQAAREYQQADRASGSHDQQRRARATVRLAEANGTMHRPATCSRPGCTEKPEAHHPDHSKPSQVVWLCDAHHGEQSQAGPM
jgi:hypothetical protein